MKIFLEKIIKKILNTKNKQDIAKNSGWLILDHAIKIIFGLLVGIWVTRYLGPADYGKLSYILALISMLTPLYLLGLDVTVPKELIYRKEDQEEILGSTFLLKFTGSFLILILAVTITFWLHPEDKIFLFLAFFVGLSYIFKSFDVIDIWFLNKLKSKYTVIARASGFIFSALLKIALILGGSSLVYFGFAVTVETLILAIVLVSLFIKTEPLFDFKKIKFGFAQSFKLLKISWIYVILGFLYLGILNIDKVMIEKIIGSYEVGLYSISSAISMLFFVFGDFIIKSVHPVLIKIDKKAPFEYYKNDVQNLFNYFVLAAYIIILCVYLTADFIIPLLWGKEYAFSSKVLFIQIFSVLFVYSGLLLRHWIIIKNFIKFFLSASILGFIVNIILNYFLIKQIGILGAAYATVIAFFFIYLLAGVFYSGTRELSKMQLKALFMLDFFMLISDKIFKLIKR